MEILFRTSKGEKTMMTTLTTAAINCAVILMYAIVICVIISMIRLLIKKIMNDVNEHKRNSDSVNRTEHVYHAS